MSFMKMGNIIFMLQPDITCVTWEVFPLRPFESTWVHFKALYHEFKNVFQIVCFFDAGNNAEVVGRGGV